jgi:hypothetical protein
LKTRILILLVVSSALAACAVPVKPSLHAALAETGKSALPQKVLLLPPDIRVNEVSAGGVVEKVDAWSEQAQDNLVRALDAYLKANPLFDPVPAPALQEPAKSTVEQHTALYDLVAGSALRYGRSTDPAWVHKSKEFDYTLGPGLKFLAEETGAHAALFVIGQDYVATEGRKVARVVGALFGVALAPSPTFVSAGVVDLETGNLLWFTYDFGVDRFDLRRPADVDQVIGDLFKEYPRRAAQ